MLKKSYTELIALCGTTKIENFKLQQNIDKLTQVN